MSQNPHDLSRMKNQAVDLNKAVAERDKERAEQAAKEEQAMAAAVRAWERAMRRTFKGIFPASSRRIFMKSAMRADQDSA